MSAGMPKPDTWPMCRGPLAYGQATAVRMWRVMPRILLGMACGASRALHADGAKGWGSTGLSAGGMDEVVDLPLREPGGAGHGGDRILAAETAGLAGRHRGEQRLRVL